MRENRAKSYNNTRAQLLPQTLPGGIHTGHPSPEALRTPSNAPGMPLKAAYRAFAMARSAARCTAKTLEHYRYTVGSFIAWLEELSVSEVDQITPSHIRAYLLWLQERDLKDTTQHAHARGIKAWLNWLVQEGDLDESPMHKVAMPKLAQRIPSPFRAEEVQRLLAACERKTAIGARDYAITLTLLDTGLRASELISLYIGDVDMRSGLITILGKGRKQRYLDLGGEDIERAHMAHSPGDRLLMPTERSLEKHSRVD